MNARDNVKKVAIGHPGMGRGGSEAACMWIIQALKDECDVTLITTRNVDLRDLNRFYGTSIEPDDIQIRIAPGPFFMKNSSGISALRGALYSRFTKEIGREYDICISTYNMSDWGVPAIHFIADFTWDLEIRDRLLPLESRQTRFIHKEGLLRKIYLGVSRKIGGPRSAVAPIFSGRHRIIANSKWTAELVQAKHGYECDEIVSPPVLAEFPCIPWARKAFRFVSIGRIAPEKRIEQQIEILEKVRRLGYDFTFHIIGGVRSDPYGQKIRNLCVDKPWIVLEGQKVGIEKDALLTGAKFAIQTCNIEAFGITVAELVKAGCIPFIPDSGGQTEIVPLKELQFGSVEEAVKKIDAMLRDSNAQKAIFQRLETQKEKLSTEQFCEQVRQIVNECFVVT